MAKAPATFIYLLAMTIGAAIPLQFGLGYDLHVDFIVSISISIVYLTSTLSSKLGKMNYRSLLNRDYRSKYYLFIASILFLLPGLTFGEFPVFVAVKEDLLSANLLREEITKKYFVYSLYLTLVFRFGLMLISFSIGYTFSNQSRSGKIFSIFSLIIAAACSIAYVQKSNPLFVLFSFFLGRLFSGDIRKKTLVLIGLIVPLQLLIIGQVLVGGGGAVIFLLDITTRRLTDVPLETLVAHFDYAAKQGPLLLAHSFTFLTGNTPLPRLVYESLGGGLALGWANSLYVGDVYANFGTVGIIIVNIVLGFIVRIGNRAAVRKEKWFGKTLGLFALGAFLFSLSNNAFFSGVQFVLCGIFLINYFFFRLRNSNRPQRYMTEVKQAARFQ